MAVAGVLTGPQDLSPQEMFSIDTLAESATFYMHFLMGTVCKHLPMHAHAWIDYRDGIEAMYQ